MCNLYSMTKGQAALRALFNVSRDSVGNLPPMRGIFPDYPAPIVRNADGGRGLTMARWGMPTASNVLFIAAKKRAAKLEAKGKQVDFKELLRMELDSGTTNVRNTSSRHWNDGAGPENRCIVPMSSASLTETLGATPGSPSTRAGRWSASRACGRTGLPAEKFARARPPTTSMPS